MRSSVLATCLVILGTSAVGCAAEPEVVGHASANLDETQGGANKVRGCHGTEPFWGISIDADRITFEDDDAKTTIVNLGPVPSRNSTVEFAALYQGSTLEEPAMTMNVIITRADGYCSDGMSDEHYPFTVSVVRGGQLFTGCCSGSNGSPTRSLASSN